MKYNTDGRVEDLLDGLVKKIEGLNRTKMQEFEESRRALASMDKLVEAMAKLEYQKRLEKNVAKRVSHIYDRLERASEYSSRGPAETRTVTETVNRILGGAKATGQIIEIVASSIQVMIETIRTVIKNQGAGTRGHTQAGETKGVDLAALLKPINQLLGSLVTNKPQASQAHEPEVVEASQPKKDEPSSVPVVKAVPVQDRPDGEKE